MIYPAQQFRGKRLWVHLGELLLRAVVYTSLIWWAAHQGVLGKFLKVWLIPGYIFSLLNSVRFIAEHYETPWEAGQLAGTRTIVSNPVNSFFWNNINYHIGHHVYPGVPWYNLQKLHRELLPEIVRQQAVVDGSYWRVFLKACCRGPESVTRNVEMLSRRKARLLPAADVS